MKNTLLSKIKEVEFLATSSKLTRFKNNPIKYLIAIFYLKVVSHFFKKGILVKALTFYDIELNIKLPSSTDIYLTGGKSHQSEINLARFLIKELSKGNHFVDIGAHYGYFTLLASKLVGEHGKVIALEAASSTFEVLNFNCNKKENITAINKAISNKIGVLNFYQFSNLYSEYNSFDLDQYKNADWFNIKNVIKKEVECITLDMILNDYKIQPNIIKIDVEGAEFKVLKGGEEHFTNSKNSIVMEYLSASRSNGSHSQSSLYLKGLGYQSYRINKNGELTLINNIDDYLKQMNYNSDNIVFKN